jgi:hypothetical protein
LQKYANVLRRDNDRFIVYQYGPNSAVNYGGDSTEQASKVVHIGPDSSGTVVDYIETPSKLRARIESDLQNVEVWFSKFDSPQK